MIELTKAISYRYVDLPNGPRLHFVFPKDSEIELFSVSVTVRYGGMRLAFTDKHGAVRKTPEGTPHFMEHLLLRTSLSMLSDLGAKYGTSPNAVVTQDQFILYAKYAGAVETHRVEAVCDIIRTLLLSLSPDIVNEQVSRIEDTKSDVLAEIRHRHSNLEYRMQVELLSSLYQYHPIRFDMLGDNDSVKSIQSSDVETALSFIKDNISAITVVGVRPTEELFDRVKETVLAQSMAQGDMHQLIPVANQPEPSNSRRRIKGIRTYEANDTACVVVGMKLPPLRSTAASADELACMNLLTYLLIRDLNLGFTGIINPETRAWLVKGNVHDSLFYIDEGDCYEVIENLRMVLLNTLATLAPRLQITIMTAYAEIIESQASLLRICHAATSFGYSLAEFISTLNLIQVADLSRLSTEISEARENISLVFASKYADLL